MRGTLPTKAGILILFEDKDLQRKITKLDPKFQSVSRVSGA
jgi:hypothetical protein